MSNNVLKRERVYVHVDPDKLPENFVHQGGTHPHIVLRTKPTWGTKALLRHLRNLLEDERKAKSNDRIVQHSLAIQTATKINEESRDAAVERFTAEGFTAGDMMREKRLVDEYAAKIRLLSTSALVLRLGGDWDLYPEEVDPSEFPRMKYSITTANMDEALEDVQDRSMWMQSLLEEDIISIHGATIKKVELSEAEVKN